MQRGPILSFVAILSGAIAVTSTTTKSNDTNPCIIDGKGPSGIVYPANNTLLQSGKDYKFLYCSTHTLKTTAKQLRIKLAYENARIGRILVADAGPPTFYDNHDGIATAHWSLKIRIESNPAQIESNNYFLETEEIYSVYESTTPLYEVAEIHVRLNVTA